ncbi:Uncharacterised protein [Mycobacteroides abscessus subsp. abscessus]|nr:Uncharacterised protein [Mycobacteroides abscessus subsp. abscessus]
MLHVCEQREERLVGLAAIAAQDGCLVERHGREQGRVELAVADRFVVGDVEPVAVDLFGSVDECEFESEHAGVAHELLPNAEGADDQSTAAAVE